MAWMWNRSAAYLTAMFVNRFCTVFLAISKKDVSIWVYTRNWYFLIKMHHSVGLVQIFSCSLLGYYTVSNDNFLPPFWDNLSVQSSRVKNSWSLKMVSIGCPEASVKNCRDSLCNSPEERSSHLLHGRSLKSCLLGWCLSELYILLQFVPHRKHSLCPL